MAAQQGNADAQDAIGDMYFFGHGVPEDDSEAVKWYRKAADQGLPGAQSSLGFIYELSETVPPDLQEAARWYRLAADQGDADAQFAIGRMYRDGHGVAQDDMLAYKWFSQAAANPDLSDKDDPVSELYSLAYKLPAGTKLDPPLPPEPFGLRVSHWTIWPVRALIAWFLGAMLWGLGSLLFEKVRAKTKPLLRVR